MLPDHPMMPGNRRGDDFIKKLSTVDPLRPGEEAHWDMLCFYLPDLPEDDFVGEDADFFAFCEEPDTFAAEGGATLTGSGSAGASFGW